MTGRPPFLPIYSHEADIKGTTFDERYTKGVPFVKNSIFKGKGLDLGAKLLRTKLY